MSIVKLMQEQITLLQDKITEVQSECGHPEKYLDKTYDGSTGGYDPSSDCYWINFHCKLCDKRWTEDQ